MMILDKFKYKRLPWLLLNSFRFNNFPLHSYIQFSRRFQKRFKKAGRKIYIVCFPKSGSTFLSKILCEITGYEYEVLISAYGQVEQDFYLPSFLDYYSKDVVVHQHLRGVDITVKAFKEFNLKPVILVRNIGDALISLNDHIHNENAFLPWFNIEKEYFEWPVERQFDFLIEYVTPWYITFYTTWQNVSNQKPFPTLLLTYEEFLKNKVKSVSDVLEFYELSVTTEVIKNAIGSMEETGSKTRLNKGIQGRSKTLLNDSQWERIKSFTRFYPDHDFTAIGL